MSRLYSVLKLLSIICIIILFDQFSKYSAINYFHKNGQYDDGFETIYGSCLAKCFGIDNYKVCEGIGGDEVPHVDLAYRPLEITSFFNLSYVWNRGITFGMLNTYDKGQWYLVCISIIAIIYFIYLTRSLILQNRNIVIGCGMIIGGAIANIIDRIMFKAVFDFLDFHIFGWHYPSFNVADISIVLGVILVCFTIYRLEKKYSEI